MTSVCVLPFPLCCSILLTYSLNQQQTLQNISVIMEQGFNVVGTILQKTGMLQGMRIR